MSSSSAGLFDYLDDAMAASLLDHLLRLTHPGGTTAICNTSPDDPSRAVNDWISDWHLLYRDEQDMRSLFARTEASVVVTRISGRQPAVRGGHETVGFLPERLRGHDAPVVVGPTAAPPHWGLSRTTSAGLLSSRSPRKRGCRSRASLVHSANPI